MLAATALAAPAGAQDSPPEFVRAGRPLMGDTGNAQGGAPHLHLRVHPNGGEPVNPHGLLRVVSDRSRR